MLSYLKPDRTRRRLSPNELITSRQRINCKYLQFFKFNQRETVFSFAYYFPRYSRYTESLNLLRLTAPSRFLDALTLRSVSLPRLIESVAGNPMDEEIKDSKRRDSIGFLVFALCRREPAPLYVSRKEDIETRVSF